MWQVTLMLGAAVCLAHVHRFIVRLKSNKSLSSKKEDKDLQICCTLSALLDCFRQRGMRTFWRQVHKCILSFLYVVIHLRSFLTFHSLRSLVMHTFWGTCFDFSKCFSNILQAWNYMMMMRYCLSSEDFWVCLWSTVLKLVNILYF